MITLLLLLLLCILKKLLSNMLLFLMYVFFFFFNIKLIYLNHLDCSSATFTMTSTCSSAIFLVTLLTNMLLCLLYVFFLKINKYQANLFESLRLLLSHFHHYHHLLLCNLMSLLINMLLFLNYNLPTTNLSSI